MRAIVTAVCLVWLTLAAVASDNAGTRSLYHVGRGHRVIAQCELRQTQVVVHHYFPEHYFTVETVWKWWCPVCEKWVVPNKDHAFYTPRTTQPRRSSFNRR